MLRRGHRLHSIGGLGDLDLGGRFGRTISSAPTSANSDVETIILDKIRQGQAQELHLMSRERPAISSQNWSFVSACAKEILAFESQDKSLESHLLKSVLEILSEANAPHSFKVGEIFVLEGLAKRKVEFLLNVLHFWANHKAIYSDRPLSSEVPTYNASTSHETSTSVVQLAVYSSLDVIHTAVYYAANRRTKDSETLALLEAVIYVATVDKQDEMLKATLQWHEDHVDLVGASVKLNADCMIHASLEDDKDRLKILYSYGYRLGPDTDRRINKDYLKRIKLFRARASPVYNIVAFEDSHDIHEHDPLKTCFEYARKARSFAGKFQDFTKEYLDIAEKCEDFAKKLLDKCTTKHEVQTLLQTRSYLGHTDANFNIAILDGHKEFVAHEKFQQMLHKKWGQRDRLQWKDTPSYNIFWSEMKPPAKIMHIIKQIFIFFILPFVVLASTLGNCFEFCFPLGYFIKQSQIPVNRFLYWEFSKWLFYGFVMATLVDEADVTWYDMITVFWIASYLLENVRTIHRLYRFSGEKTVKRIFKRWLTFRNLYILFTDIVFLLAFILRCVSFFTGQCRDNCPYEGNEVAFIAGTLWSVAALLAFLRVVQIGLMWRQTGPIIISMSYMIFDVMVFLFIFVIVYISFTLSMVHIYNVYNEDRTQFFTNHKSAFKLFFWALIRTGNPQFADIRVFNGTSTFNKTCLSTALVNYELIGSEEVKACALSKSKDAIEEAIPYVAGNSLWAFYQFTVFIVLLSILRARMVNTYHRIFKEADVQWKFFRASIWWKYLDGESVLPPPFTIFYLLHKLIASLYHRIAEIVIIKTAKHRHGSAAEIESPTLVKKKEQEVRRANDKKQFEKRYTHLMLTLTQSNKYAQEM